MIVRKPEGPFHAPDDYGGGGRGGTGVNYFYLVINNAAASDVGGQEIQSFYKTAVNTDGNHIFVMIDISSDQRLAKDLAKVSGGPELYAQIEANASVFLLSPKRIPDLGTIAAVEMVPIKNYEKDIDVIYAKMGLNSATTRASAIAFLRWLNDSFHLKPNIMGLGVNLNQMISDLLARLERAQP